MTARGTADSPLEDFPPSSALLSFRSTPSPRRPEHRAGHRQPPLSRKQANVALSPRRRTAAAAMGDLKVIELLIGLPALAIGTWAGMSLFGKLDDTGFRRVAMVLLLLSGPSFVVFR